jgi:hypothetical protein
MFGARLNKLGAPSKQAPFAPTRLFADSEGFYNDIQTYSTSYFTDTAGTDPAVLEDTIGLVLDQSGNDIDLTQATAGARPKLSARYNLLERTEEFDNAYWSKSGSGTGTAPVVTANFAEAPNGSMTAERVQFNQGAGTASADFSLISRVFSPALPSDFYAHSIHFKSNTSENQIILAYNTGNQVGQEFTVTPEWQRFVLADSDYLTSNYIEGSANFIFGIRGGELTYFHGPNTPQTADILVWGGQTDPGTVATRYQRVTTATDYDSEGFDPYLQFDQVDDALTATIPAITGGTLVLATRQGIWIDDDINASAGTFSIGPTTYTGGPAGLLSVIGNKLIGPPVLLDRQLTASEKNALVQWFQNRGAGALYVLGEEVITNGTFDTDTDWSKGTGWTISDGTANFSVTGSSSPLQQSIAVTGGKPYLTTFTTTIEDGTLQPNFTGGSSVFLIARTSSGTYSQVVFAAAGNNLFRFTAGSTFTGSVDNLSVRQLTQPGA